MQIILGSASPRRKELLKLLFDSFTVLTSDCEEKAELITPGQYVEELSHQKAIHVFDQYKISPVFQDEAVIIGADTIVYLNGQILGKPHSQEHARQMLFSLSGKSHQVYTGVSLLYCSKEKTIKKQVQFHECTSVLIDTLSDEEINSYIATHESDDKAGSYAIQGLFARHISGIEGDYFNVVGLPVHALYKAFQEHFPFAL